MTCHLHIMTQSSLRPWVLALSRQSEASVQCKKLQLKSIEHCVWGPVLLGRNLFWFVLFGPKIQYDTSSSSQIWHFFTLKPNQLLGVVKCEPVATKNPALSLHQSIVSLLFGWNWPALMAAVWDWWLALQAPGTTVAQCRLVQLVLSHLIFSSRVLIGCNQAKQVSISCWAQGRTHVCGKDTSIISWKSMAPWPTLTCEKRKRGSWKEMTGDTKKIVETGWNNESPQRQTRCSRLFATANSDGLQGAPGGHLEDTGPAGYVGPCRAGARCARWDRTLHGASEVSLVGWALTWSTLKHASNLL